MSDDFDQFDAMGDDFFGGAAPLANGDGRMGGFEDEDTDMFSMFEEGAKNETAAAGGFGELFAENQSALTSTTVSTQPATAAAQGTTSMGVSLDAAVSTQPSLSPSAAPYSVSIGSKRPREGPTSSDAKPISQDFGVLHSDPLFKSLFTTPESIVLATPIVVNCIGLVYLGCGVDLRALACSVRNVEYNCSRAPRAVLRLVEPHCSAIIRSNGVVTIVGSGSVQATKTAAELTARIIRCALGLTDLLAIKFRLRTLMVRFDLQRPVRIGNLAAANPGCASYEPETFCACILRLMGTIYSDGKTFEEATEAAAAKSGGDLDGQGGGGAANNSQYDYPTSIPTGANQAEIDDFFGFGADEGNFGADFGTTSFGTQPTAVTAPAPQTQARALTAIRWSISVNVFVSGKTTMIGAKSVDEVAAAYSKLLRLVQPHMKLD